MPAGPSVEDHYDHGRLVEAITEGLAGLGKTPRRLTVDDLGPVDEFHVGGRQASRDLIAQLALSADHHVLDIGCGLGGTSRLVAAQVGCRVWGVDLSAEYVAAARTLSHWVGLGAGLSFDHASALHMPFDDATFDAAFMLHVGMNIPDKAALFAEAARVLRPGARLGIYDVMKTGEGELAFPVPWAGRAETSAVASPEAYKAALGATGFEVVAERDRRDLAMELFAAGRVHAARSDGPPPLGMHIVMGADAPAKVANLAADIEAGHLAPVEIIARLGG